jgi:hypothetical protein
MSSPKLGTLMAHVRLEDSERRHYGSQNPVTGLVVLNYLPSTSMFGKKSETVDLFGPVKIELLIQGKIKIRIRRDRDIPSQHGVDLFRSRGPVFEGSVKAHVHEELKFPFAMNLPEAGAIPQDMLPPSFAHHFSDYPDIVDVAVRYKLGVAVSMPGIDIKTSVPEGDAMPLIKYDIPRPSMSLLGSNRVGFKSHARIQHSSLLPVDERPQGFKQKAKAMFSSSSFPVLLLDVYCIYPPYLYASQLPRLEISVRKDDAHTTATYMPDITLVALSMQLIAITNVDSRHRILGSSECHDTRTVQTFQRTSIRPVELTKVNDFATKVDLDRVATHSSSFVHAKVSRQYLLKIEMKFNVADKPFKMTKEQDVIVVPPPLDEHLDYTEPPPMAGPSCMHGEEQLPSYQEAQEGLDLNAKGTV